MSVDRTEYALVHKTSLIMAADIALRALLRRLPLKAGVDLAVVAKMLPTQLLLCGFEHACTYRPVACVDGYVGFDCLLRYLDEPSLLVSFDYNLLHEWDGAEWHMLASRPT